LIDRFVDLSEVRGHLAPFYSSTGRPSIDPELLVRMLLVGYCYGIRSERRLCEEVHLKPASPLQHEMLADVSDGSKTVLTTLKSHFRSSPNNGHHLADPIGPFSATTGLMHRSKVSGISTSQAARSARQWISLRSYPIRLSHRIAAWPSLRTCLTRERRHQSDYRQRALTIPIM